MARRQTHWGDHDHWLKRSHGGLPGWIIAAASVLIVICALATVNLYVDARAAQPDATEQAAAAADVAQKLADIDRKASERAAQEEYDRQFHITMPTDRPLSMFFAGDSLGAGFYSTERDQAYRWLVEDYFEQFGEVKSTASIKDPADPQPLSQIGNATNVPDSGVDVAIIELGTNDANRTEMPLFRERYANLMDRIWAGSPDAVIVCAGIWGEGGVTAPTDAVISDVCRSKGGKYVDLTRHFAAKDTYGPDNRDTWAGPSDNWHPNDLGHRLIADEILSVLTVD